MTPLYIYFSPQLNMIPFKIWILLITTGFFQSAYYIGLGNAYRLSDVSLIYPMARALPVIFVPVLCTTISYGKNPSTPALAGMGLITVGCLILPQSGIRTLSLKNYLNVSFVFVLIAAFGTTAYTVIDSMGVQGLSQGDCALSSIEAAMCFVSLENISILIFMIVYVSVSARERINMTEIYRNSFRYPVLCGIVCTCSYTLVLIAMQFASNVSYIMAFRQVSIPIGVFLGVFLLKEKSTIPKIIGVSLILAGLIMVVI